MVRPPPAESLLGRVLNGRFRPVQVLGGVPWSMVYAADLLEREKLVGRVAWRVLHWSDDSTSPPFLPDVALMRSQQCELLVDTQQVGEVRLPSSHKAMFLVSELADRNSTTAQNGAELIEVCLAAAQALVYLHGRSLLHGHLTPTRLVKAGSSWKVAGFGLVPPRPRPLLADAAWRDQLGYVAPELHAGRVSTASDLWSLGALMLFLLTGQTPAADGLVPSDLAPPFDLVIPGLLQSAPELRWPAERVLAVLRGEPFAPLPAPSPRRPERLPETGGEAATFFMPARVQRLCIDRLGHRLAIGLKDGTVTLVADGRLLWSTARPVSAVTGLTWLDDTETRLAVTTRDGTFRVLHAETGHILEDVQTGLASLHDLFRHGTRLFAAAGRDGVVCLSSSGRAVQVWEKPCCRLAMQRSPDTLMTSWLDGLVSLADMEETGHGCQVRHRATLELHSGQVTSVCATPRGFLSTSLDGTAAFTTSAGHVTPIASGAIELHSAAAGASAALGAADGTVMWWRGEESTTVVAHGQAVVALAVGDTRWASASRRGVVKLWPL